jgi:hypothetical protein
MPPILKKQVFGLPAWAWLAITSVALGVGLYARHKANENKGEDTGDPCDAESQAYDPATCNQGSISATPQAGYDSGDPCDPSSVAYEPASCTAGQGLGYSPGGVGGGYNSATGEGTGIPSYEYPESPAEVNSAEQGGVNITAPLVEQNITEAPKSSSKKQPGCKTKNRPKVKKGYTIECQGGRWHYVPKSHAGKKKKKNPTHKMTGGGAPHKKNDKLAH